MAEIASPPVISPDPAKYAMAAFQMIDTAARDRRRLQLQEEAQKQQAIEAARAAKAQDFNAMMAQLKLDQDKYEFGVTARQRDYANETARAGAGNRAELAGQNMALQAERLGLQQQAMDLRSQRADSGNTALAGLLGVPVVDAALPAENPTDVAPAEPVGGLTEFGQPMSSDTGVVNELGTAPGVPDDSLLFPGFASEGAQGGEGATGPAATPGQPQIEGLVEFGPEPPPAFTTIDPGFSRMMEEQGRIQQQLRDAQMSAVEAQNQARAISGAINRADNPDLISRGNQKLGQLSRSFAGAQADVQKAESALKTLAPKAARAEQIAAQVRSLAPLDGILPPADMLALQNSLKDAPNLPLTAKPLQDLQILSEYGAIRQSAGLTAPSNGLATASEVVKAYKAATNEQLLSESQPAVSMLADLKSDLEVTRRGALVEDGAGALVRKKPDKTSDPEGYKAWFKDIDDLEKDIRRTEQRAAPYEAAQQRFKDAIDADRVKPAEEAKQETPKVAVSTAVAPAPAPAPQPSLRLSGENAVSAVSPVSDWWTAQKNEVLLGRGSDGRSRVPGMEEYDNEVLLAVAQEKPVYRSRKGGITLNENEAPQQQSEMGGTVAVPVGDAGEFLARQLGFDPKAVPSGGSDSKNTGNRWYNPTYSDITREAARDILKKRGLWKDGKPVNTSQPSPEDSEALKAFKARTQ